MPFFARSYRQQVATSVKPLCGWVRSSLRALTAAYLPRYAARDPITEL